MMSTGAPLEAGAAVIRSPWSETCGAYEMDADAATVGAPARVSLVSVEARLGGQKTPH